MPETIKIFTLISGQETILKLTGQKLPSSGPRFCQVRVGSTLQGWILQDRLQSFGAISSSNDAAVQWWGQCRRHLSDLSDSTLQNVDRTLCNALNFTETKTVIVTLD